MTDVESYRAALAAWRDAALARVRDPSAPTLAEQKANAVALGAARLAGPAWPAEYGGHGGTAEHERVFEEIVGAVPALLPPRLVTYGVCAPTLREFGSEQQRRRHLPGMLSGADIWAQLLSEPGAGSDLASVATRGRRVTGGWSLTGQKVWTSRADVAAAALALVRTGDGAEQRRAGMTVMIVDMAAPGIDVRPLREMTGEAIFNEVFLTDVFVPDEDVVGEVGGGWAVLLGMLRHEREAVGGTGAANTIYRERGAELLERVRRMGEAQRARVQHDLLRLVSWERAHEALAERVAKLRRDGGDSRPFGSLSKASMSSLSVYASDLSARIDGVALRGPEDAEAMTSVHALLKSPMAGIAGGTTEIQKNTIARQILELDRGARR